MMKKSSKKPTTKLPMIKKQAGVFMPVIGWALIAVAAVAVQFVEPDETVEHSEETTFFHH